MFATCSAAVRSRLTGLAVTVALVGQLAAQDLPPPPADRLLDDTRALSDTERTKVTNDLAKFHTEFGYDVWIAASTFLASGRTARQHARELRQAWSGDQSAVVFVYDRASESHSLSVAPALWDRYSPARLILLMQQCTALMSDLQRPVNERLFQTAGTITRTLRLLEKHHKQLTHPLPAGARRLATRFAPLLLFGAALTAAAGFWLRRQDVLTNWQLLFPSVQVGIRLGAPFGGGSIVEWQPLSPLQSPPPDAARSQG